MDNSIYINLVYEDELSLRIMEKIIEKRKKELKGCYGSYQVMKKNLEKH